MTEPINHDFDRLTAVAYRNFKRCGLADDDAQREAVSFAYGAAELLRERLAEAAVEYAAPDTTSVVAQEHNRRVSRNASAYRPGF